MRKDRIKQAATDGSSDTIPDSQGIGEKIQSLNREAIEKLAYQYWLERGCPEGSAGDDWFQAERTLLSSTVRPASPDTGRAMPGRAEAQTSAFGAVMKAAG
jgi:Protein of unknown function (DUF2934)